MTIFQMLRDPGDRLGAFRHGRPDSENDRARRDEEETGSFWRDFGEIIERHGADDAQTLCAQFIHRVARRMPGRKSKSIRSIVGMPIALKGV